VDRELGQPVDLVPPQVDPQRIVGGGREDVDDRASARHLAAVFHQFLAAVAHRHQPGQHVVGVEGLAGADNDRLRRLIVGVRAESLEQGADPGHDDPRPAVRLGQPPEDTQTPPHRLDARAHPLEGQGLPGGEELDVIRRQQLSEVVGQALRAGARRHGDEQRAAAREPAQAGQREGASRLRHRQRGRATAEHGGQRGFVAQQRGE
jgi:hypothetical protein